MKTKFSGSIVLLASITVVMLCAANSPSQTVQIVQVYKSISYVQTNATTAIVGPPAGPGPTNGGPYGFQADVIGTNIGGISPPALTLPSGSTFDDPGNFDGYLAYNTNGYDSYGPMWAFGLVETFENGNVVQVSLTKLF